MGRRMGRSIRVLRPRVEPRPRENATEIHLRSYRLEETLRSRLARTPHTSNTRPRARRNPLTNTTVILQVPFDLSFDNTTWHFSACRTLQAASQSWAHLLSQLAVPRPQPLETGRGRSGSHAGTTGSSRLDLCHPYLPSPAGGHVSTAFQTRLCSPIQIANPADGFVLLHDSLLER